MDNKYLVALHTIEGLGSKRLQQLLSFFADPREAWEASKNDWVEAKIPKQVIENWQNSQKTLDPQKYSEQLLQGGIKVLSILEKDYPDNLKQISDPPFLIYFKGVLPIQDKKTIAVVGTRKVTSYGRSVTEKLTAQLVEFGFIIVSGLARGVDSIAHQTTLKNGGVTIAVLGQGVNIIYPPENERLAAEIVGSGGCLLSEHPPNYPVSAGVFPSRNRIISGLSQGVVVTEAAQDSGSLITAHQALEQGREVFAVPGPITSGLSKGPADLIKQGAKLVFSIDDILEELGVSKTPPPKVDYTKLSSLELAIIKELENEQKHIDELCRQLKKPSFEISSSLIKLEIQGLVKNLGSGYFLRL